MGNLRNLPPVDEILLEPQVQNLLQTYNRDFVTSHLRQALDEVRAGVRTYDQEFSRSDLTVRILERLQLLISSAAAGTLRQVINGTGVVLHTNLGRSPLGRSALQYITATACSYCNLEFDLESGNRGSRYQHVEDLLIQLTGAEAALVVNNNAAAVLLGLNTVAANRQVIVSRGQLVEIGGAFRIPEVMKQSGAVLVEVGTTNKTYISDFAGAINEETALLFSAHPSNYKIVGFTDQVKLAELVRLGREYGLPVMEDLGSGVFFDLGPWGLKEEPLVKDSVSSGADIVTFSGDKLLGGPQAGIIVGKKTYIEAMKKNQLTRALRVDKLTIAALEGTLLEYLKGTPEREIPILQMLTTAPEVLHQRAQELAQLLESMLNAPMIADIEVIKVEDMVGGGAYPIHELPGYAVKITFREQDLEDISHKMRQLDPAVLTRKQDDGLLISVRTLLPGDDIRLVQQIGQALKVL